MIALAVGAVAAGALLGAIRLEAIDTAARRGGPDGAVVSGTAILLEHPRPSQFGSSTAIRMTQGRATGAMLLAGCQVALLALGLHPEWSGEQTLVALSPKSLAEALEKGTLWRKSRLAR